MAPDQKAVWNERTKLTCTALSNIAVAFAVAGVVVPLISGISIPASLEIWVRLAPIVWWFGLATAIYLSARAFLGRIQA